MIQLRPCEVTAHKRKNGVFSFLFSFKSDLTPLFSYSHLKERERERLRTGNKESRGSTVAMPTRINDSGREGTAWGVRCLCWSILCFGNQYSGSRALAPENLDSTTFSFFLQVKLRRHEGGITWSVFQGWRTTVLVFTPKNLDLEMVVTISPTPDQFEVTCSRETRR